MALGVQLKQFHAECHREWRAQAHVAMNEDHEAVFELIRADVAECTVKLLCIRGRELRVYMSKEA